MFGHLLAILKEFLGENFGSHIWKEVIAKSKCPENIETCSQYPEGIWQTLIQKSLDVTGYKRDTLLSHLGEFYLEYLRRSGHDEVLRNLGEDMLSFLTNLDYMHTYVMKDYPGSNMPSFKCEVDSRTDEITLHYFSFREGLCPLVMGLLGAVAKTYFNSKLRIEIISTTSEEVAGKKGKREHVILALSVVKIQFGKYDEAPPTLVAQTKKAGEKQILKRDVDDVEAKLDQIRRQFGEDELPVNKARKMKLGWSTIARIGMLAKGFCPEYPKQLSFGVKTFCDAFPYHIVLNESMEIVHAGSKLQQILPSIRSPGSRIDTFFDLLHPHSMTFTYVNITRFINTPFIIRARTSKMSKDWSQCPPLVLRGQMLFDEDEDDVLYMSSPFVRSLKDLEERHLFLSDIPMHDVTRDMLWDELSLRYKRNSSSHTPSGARSTGDSGYSHPADRGYNDSADRGYNPRGDRGYARESATPVTVPVPYIVHVTDHGIPEEDMQDTEDSEELKRQVQRLRDQLATERERNAQLYTSFLPRQVATQIRSGQTPEARQFPAACVLFCDIVAFTEIIVRCKAAETVQLLTQLHGRFETACSVHNTYRVEAVADAFLVVSGVPDQHPAYVDRGANTALAMLLSARDVHSPFNYGDKTKHIKVRIGLHTGPVICGVVGNSLPRYLVMGDTVNMASKLESHGVAGRIQISDVTYELLKKKPFRIEKRGAIEIRGRGRMTTYLLLGNEAVPADELLGRPTPRDNNEVTFINEGRQERVPPPSSSTTAPGTPVTSRNQVAPDTGPRTVDTGRYYDRRGNTRRPPRY